MTRLNSPENAAADIDHDRRKFASTRQLLEDDSRPIERIERLGKCLFGVAGCLVLLHDENGAFYEERQTAQSDMQLFFARLPVCDEFLVVPPVPSLAPFQAPHGRIGSLNVHFYAIQPVRDSDRQVVGSVCLAHDRPRAFTAADRQLLADLGAMVERELHLKFMIAFQADLQKKNKTLRRKSLIDPLMGTWNRGAILRILTIEAVRCKKLGLPLAVIVVDLDHFKKVNDTYGHPAGDAVLSKAASLLRSCIRPQEAVGRYGGEEFLVVLPGATHTTAKAVAERMRQTVALQSIEWGKTPIRMTMSAGIAATDVFPSAAADELISRADTALYAAKSGGRNLVVQAALGSPDQN